MKFLLTTLTLLVGALVPLAGAQDAPPDFEALEARYQEEADQWRQRYIQARRDDADATVLAELEAADPVHSYLPQFQAGADAHGEEPGAAPFLEWIVSMAGRKGDERAGPALDRIVAHHLGHPSLERLDVNLGILATRYDFDRARSLRALGAMAEAADTKPAEASALYWRAYVVSGTTSTDEERAQAERDLVRAAEIGDERTRAEAQGMLFEIRHLQIGMVAPDIEGEDLDGTNFSLSEYRGKVVMLDFWGDW